MTYYQIVLDPAEDDDPSELYLELDSRNGVRRKLEAYQYGVYLPFDDIEETFDVEPYRLSGAVVTVLTRGQFEDIWARSREMPMGFMGMQF